MALNPKQQAFIQAYIKTKNATTAAIAAGYSKRTARTQGSYLLTNPDIKHAVARGLFGKLKRADITADKVIEQLASIAFLTVDELEELPFKSADKTKCLETLAKHFKLLTDITEHQGAGGGPVVVLTMPANGSEVTGEIPSEPEPTTKDGRPEPLPVSGPGDQHG